MRSRYLPLAGLLIIGILGASGLTIENSISGSNLAEIARIAAINNIQISKIADEDAIEAAIAADEINSIQIEESEISNASLIAIATIINDEIQAELIDADITEIAA
jgi:hypothetical protein